MVPKAGLEPARLAPPPPQDGVSTNSTTSAYFYFCRPRSSQKTTALKTLHLFSYFLLFFSTGTGTELTGAPVCCGIANWSAFWCCVETI